MRAFVESIRLKYIGSTEVCVFVFFGLRVSLLLGNPVFAARFLAVIVTFGREDIVVFLFEGDCSGFG